MASIDPTINTAAIAALEAALNKAIALDPASHAGLAPLAGKVFRFQCTRPALDIYLFPQPGSEGNVEGDGVANGGVGNGNAENGSTEGGSVKNGGVGSGGVEGGDVKGRALRLAGHWDGETTAAVRGKAHEFAQLLSADDPAAELINGPLELHGESAPLIALQNVLSQLAPDWEAPLVETFGDVVGHQLAEGLRGLSGWGRQASAGLTRQLEEFIHEEARLAPSRLEVEDFRRDLDELNRRIDRLQTRLRRARETIGA